MAKHKVQIQNYCYLGIKITKYDRSKLNIIRLHKKNILSTKKHKQYETLHQNYFLKIYL